MVDWKTNPLGWLKDQVNKLWAQIADTAVTLKNSIKDLKETVTGLEDKITGEIADRKDAIDGILDTAKDAAKVYVDEALKPLGVDIATLTKEIKDKGTWMSTVADNLLKRLKVLEDLDLEKIPDKIAGVKDDLVKKIKTVTDEVTKIQNILTDPEKLVDLILDAISEMW